jgi:hypothetical protein
MIIYITISEICVIFIIRTDEKGEFMWKKTGFMKKEKNLGSL